MACVHLRKLYQLCQDQQLYFSGSDLVRIVCKECEMEEACPTTLTLGGDGKSEDSNEAGTAQEEGAK